MNAMKFDAMVVGNHEFDFGPKVLKERMAQARFPVLGANVKGVSGLKPYVIKNLQGVKIAIIGVVTPDTPFATHPRNVAGLTFSTPESAVKKYLQELKGRADIIVVLSHCGFQADKELAASGPGDRRHRRRPFPHQDSPTRGGGPDHHRPGLGTRQGPGDFEP